MIAISIDGRRVGPDEAVISVLDRGLLYGDGLFEVIRAASGVAIWLDDHLDRLYASAEALALRVPPRAELAAWIREAVRDAGPGDHRVRVVVTRGPGPLAARLAELPGGRAIVIVEPLAPPPRALSLATVEWPVPRRGGPAHKTLAYLDHVIARELAAAAGADEAIRLDAAGDVVEGATCNVFAVIAGSVVTPPLAGILPGVTRARVLVLCAGLGLAPQERRLSPRDLAHADELFVTSALRGVVAVTSLDGVPRAAGPITSRIARAYTQAARALL